MAYKVNDRRKMVTRTLVMSLEFRRRAKGGLNPGDGSVCREEGTCFEKDLFVQQNHGISMSPGQRAQWI